jgi:hypothetical protein
MPRCAHHLAVIGSRKTTEAARGKAALRERVEDLADLLVDVARHRVVGAPWRAARVPV